MSLISILTDFGSKDYYVSSMKGAILSINPEVQIVDITHEIPKQNVRSTSFVLANAAKTFPKGSIFVVVVDPGVGSGRKIVLLETKNDLRFIGPDNGVFTHVSKEFGIEEIREVTNEELFRSNISNTFHGRDVMAPVAAHLSSGVDPSKVGQKLKELKLLDIEEPRISNKEIEGEILHTDDFGNLVTNIDQSMIEEILETGDKLKIEIGNKKFEAPFLEAFSDVPIGNILCYIGSASLLEIAKNQGNLASDLKETNNSKIRIKPVE